MAAEAADLGSAFDGGVTAEDDDEPEGDEVDPLTPQDVTDAGGGVAFVPDPLRLIEGATQGAVRDPVWNAIEESIAQADEAEANDEAESAFD